MSNESRKLVVLDRDDTIIDAEVYNINQSRYYFHGVIDAIKRLRANYTLSLATTGDPIPLPEVQDYFSPNYFYGKNVGSTERDAFVYDFSGGVTRAEYLRHNRDVTFYQSPVTENGVPLAFRKDLNLIKRRVDPKTPEGICAVFIGDRYELDNNTTLSSPDIPLIIPNRFGWEKICSLIDLLLANQKPDETFDKMFNEAISDATLRPLANPDIITVQGQGELTIVHRGYEGSVWAMRRTIFDRYRFKGAPAVVRSMQYIY